MSTRIIQVRPSRNPRWQKQGGWEVFEAEGVCPVYCGENGRQNALDYARQRMGYGRCDLQVLDENWNVVETIGSEDLKPVVGRNPRFQAANRVGAGKRDFCSTSKPNAGSEYCSYTGTKPSSGSDISPKGKQR